MTDDRDISRLKRMSRHMGNRERHSDIIRQEKINQYVEAEQERPVPRYRKVIQKFQSQPKESYEASRRYAQKEAMQMSREGRAQAIREHHNPYHKERVIASGESFSQKLHRETHSSDNSFSSQIQNEFGNPNASSINEALKNEFSNNEHASINSRIASEFNSVDKPKVRYF